MKKLLLLGTACMVVFIMGYIIGCIVYGNATRTTEYWVYNNETKEMVLVDTKVEEIDGIFDEKAKVTIKIN